VRVPKGGCVAGPCDAAGPDTKPSARRDLTGEPPRPGEADIGPALAFFGAQLVLNALWSWLFFGWHRPDLAFLEVIVLWLTILGTVITFWRVSPAAGKLLLPYLAWVGFAGLLNWELWRLNPGVVGRAVPTA
jgi:hypothetical protein